MPHLIKSHIYGANVDLQFKKFQYGWLLNFLAFLDKSKEKIPFNYFCTVVTKQLYRLPMCSVWHPLPYIKKSYAQQIENYSKGRITASLMYTSGEVVNMNMAWQDVGYYLRIPWILSGKL
jgi:hypothetical protein